MSEENKTNPIIATFLGLTALTGVFAGAKLLGFLGLSWVVLLIPLAVFSVFFTLVGVIYAACMAAFYSIEKKIKTQIEEALSHNTELTITAMAQVIVEGEPKNKEGNT